MVYGFAHIIVQRADLESRQSGGIRPVPGEEIVQRADLESRQSWNKGFFVHAMIVQRADLESRQSWAYRRPPPRRLCKERIWNQGKAPPWGAHIDPDCAKSGFGIKAKPRASCGAMEPIVQRADLESRQSGAAMLPAVSAIVQRADLESRQSPACSTRLPNLIVQRADLESRQSTVRKMAKRGAIVQRADLESRQSAAIGYNAYVEIVQRADLESRQSNTKQACEGLELCKERIWNQGKAALTLSGLTAGLCKERIWNQGKAERRATRAAAHCAKSGFGIKAKQVVAWFDAVSIVQRADLESRQSQALTWCKAPRLCKERIWNQGKATGDFGSYLIALCKERIWNQGKAVL